MPQSAYLSAGEAAEELGISLATLYSYVSRGLIRSEEADRRKRTRRYRREDVDKLKTRREQRRNPAKAVEGALHWGAPLLESAITLIEDSRFYYRGHDVLRLAATSMVEQVAALIWAGSPEAEIPGLIDPPPAPLSTGLAALRRQVQELPAVEQFQTLLPLAAAEDLAGYDLRPPAVAQTGARILHLMTAIAAGEEHAGGAIAHKLQQGWRPKNPQAAKLINLALILCADHELNVSSFTARCVASAGASPYQAVMAGLAALQGVNHGRNTERVEAFLREAETPAGVRAAIAGRLRRGESIPGFGHFLYPQGDPRGRALLQAITAAYPDSSAAMLVSAVTGEVQQVTGERPNVDFGLVALARSLRLPPGSPIALFALGRIIGWVGQVIEQYQLDRMIRPRARYIGQPPVDS